MYRNDSDLRHSLGMLLGRTSRAILNRLQKSFAQAGYTISVEQWLLLVNLRSRNGQTQQQLAENTYKDKTTVARLIDGLEKHGLVNRMPDTIDRRQKRISLHAKGRKLLKQLKPLALSAQTEAQQGVSSEHLDICREVLFTIYGNMQKQ